MVLVVRANVTDTSGIPVPISSHSSDAVRFSISI